MQEPLILDVSPEAAQYVSSGASAELKLRVAGGSSPLVGGDLGSVLLFLCHDNDPEVSKTAIASIQSLSGKRLQSVLEAPETHSFLLDILCRLNTGDTFAGELIALHPSVSLQTLEFLTALDINGASDAYLSLIAISEAVNNDDNSEYSDEENDDDNEFVEEEYKSKYQLAQTMPVADKIKMALTGDKEWRGLLIKDINKMVSGSVVKNPRITDSEILTISKMALQNDEILRAICTNKEWVKNYNIRKSLVENSKTPLPFALRFMSTLSEKDLSSLAKSKNISSVVSSQARRLLTNKK